MVLRVSGHLRSTTPWRSNWPNVSAIYRLDFTPYFKPPGFVPTGRNTDRVHVSTNWGVRSLEIVPSEVLS